MDFYSGALGFALPLGARMAAERSLERVPLLDRLGGKAVVWGVK